MADNGKKNKRFYLGGGVVLGILGVILLINGMGLVDQSERSPTVIGIGILLGIVGHVLWYVGKAPSDSSS